MIECYTHISSLCFFHLTVYYGDYYIVEYIFTRMNTVLALELSFHVFANHRNFYVCVEDILYLNNKT